MIMTEPLYHIVSVNVNTTKTVRMTRYPMNEESCRVMMGKITTYKWRELVLEPCSTLTLGDYVELVNVLEKSDTKAINLKDSGRKALPCHFDAKSIKPYFDAGLTPRQAIDAITDKVINENNAILACRGM